MLFDAKIAVSLYRRAKRGDAKAIEEFHSVSVSLIEAIAASLGSQFDDLVQEGHLRIQRIIVESLYDPARGSMYSFLSTTLRNAMIDYLRKDREDLELPEETFGDNHTNHTEESPIISNYVEYMVLRFPTIDPAVLDRIVDYAVKSTRESVSDGCKGVIRTMCVEYGIGRRWSSTMYSVVLALMRMDALGIEWEENICDALAIAKNGTALSLIPELVLLNGPELVRGEVKVFAGSYIKF